MHIFFNNFTKYNKRLTNCEKFYNTIEEYEYEVFI